MKILCLVILFQVLIAVDEEHDGSLRGEPTIEDGDDGEESSYMPGAQVVNAILADMWPSLGDSILTNIRANPVLVDPFVLKIKSGKFRYAPMIEKIELLTPPPPLPPDVPDDACQENRSMISASMPPPRFQCAVAYKGWPGLDIVLTGADAYNKHRKVKVVSYVKRWLRRLVPDIFVKIISVDLHAHMEVELDMNRKRIAFFFVERPRVEWNLEFSLTKAQLPMVGENTLDSILTQALGMIDRENPIRVVF